MKKTEHKIDRIKGNGGFFSGVAVLTLSTLFVKAVGALFKIPMIKYVGIEGMGYFNAAYHFYSLLMTVSTAGLPVALSLLISEDVAKENTLGVKSDFICAVRLFCTLGAIFSAILLVFSGEIADFLAIPNTKYCLLAVSPAVLFVTVSGAFRGYFQGHGIMTPTAVSQMIEAVGKLFLGLGAAVFALKRNKPPYIVSAYAIFGLTLGILISSLYLLVAKKLHDRRYRSSTVRHTSNAKRSTYLRLIKTAFPVTLSSAVLSLTALLDTLVIPNSLMRAGIDEYTALNLYSTYTNLALPLFAFPTAFITPISLVLIPAVSSAQCFGDAEHRDRVFSLSLRLCAFMTLPCVFLMSALSFPILSIVFSGGSSAIAIGAKLLSVLSASVFFSGLITVTNAMLQSCARQSKPIISLALGAGVKLVSEMLLVSSPTLNIFGAPMSTFLCSLTVLIANFYFLSEVTENKIYPIRLFTKPLVCAALSGIVSAVSYFTFSDRLGMTVAFLLSAIIALIIYIPLFFKTGAFLRDDILMLPSGEKIYRILEKLKLTKQYYKYNTEVKNERRKT